MGTIRFVLRPDKATKEGKQPVELIYQVEGNRKYYRTKEKLWPAHWDHVDQKAIYLDRRTAKKLLPKIGYNDLPTSKEIAEVNTSLNKLISSIKDIEKRFELDSIRPNSKMVIDKLKILKRPLIKKEDPTNHVFDFIDRYIDENKATREPGSLTVYKSLKNHLQAFQKEKGIRVLFSEIDTSFFRKFQAFLLIPRKRIIKDKVKLIRLNNVTVAKQLSTLKTFLNYAKAAGVPVPDKYKDFKIKKETLEVIALTNDEFEKLFNLDLSDNKKLDQVRDVFCFSCATGLRYSDLNQLKRENIKNDEIRITVKKTKEPLSIPLNPYSHFIIDKYRNIHKPLPVISNQKTNEYIKELCKMAEISDLIEIVRFIGTKRESTTYPKHELVSIHTGRKTFATLSLEKGMSAEEVMEIGGWVDYKSFKRYVKVTEQRKKVVMRNAWGEIKIPKLKAV